MQQQQQLTLLLLPREGQRQATLLAGREGLCLKQCSGSTEVVVRMEQQQQQQLLGRIAALGVRGVQRGMHRQCLNKLFMVNRREVVLLVVWQQQYQQHQQPR